MKAEKSGARACSDCNALPSPPDDRTAGDRSAAATQDTTVTPLEAAIDRPIAWVRSRGNWVVLDAIKSGRLSAFRLNRMWLIPRDAVDRLL